MKSQQFFIRQLYFFLACGVLAIVFLGLRHYELLDRRSPINETGLQLIWNGSILIVDKPENIGCKTERLGQLPAELMPMFFRPIPINDADFELLLTIPGIGPKLASEIGITRKRLGGFRKEDDLLLIRGIGRNKMNHLKEYFSFQ